MADLHFELVTPDRMVMSEDVYMVVIPGTEGEVRNHGRACALHDDAQERRNRRLSNQGAQPERIKVTGGFAEVSDSGLTVLAESAG